MLFGNRKYVESVLIVAFAITVAQVVAQPAMDDTRRVSGCGFFKEAMELSLPPAAKIKYVEDNFSTRVYSEDFKTVFDVIFQSDPVERYELFVESMNHSEPGWACPALREFFELFIGNGSL